MANLAPVGVPGGFPGGIHGGAPHMPTIRIQYPLAWAAALYYTQGFGAIRESRVYHSHQLNNGDSTVLGTFVLNHQGFRFRVVDSFFADT